MKPTIMTREDKDLWRKGGEKRDKLINKYVNYENKTFCTPNDMKVYCDAVMETLYNAKTKEEIKKDLEDEFRKCVEKIYSMLSKDSSVVLDYISGCANEDGRLLLAVSRWIAYDRK